MDKDFSSEPWNDLQHSVEVRMGYESLHKVLVDALDQAQFGKGAKRHNLAGETRFDDQIVMTITRLLGVGFPLGQATKKILESQRSGMDGLAQRAELYGAIIYIAAAIMYTEEMGIELRTNSTFNPAP
jgi:hypothetical protein